jgi:hypothetical protein
MAVSAVLPVPEQKARRFLGIAATLGVLGIATNLGNEGESLLPKVIAGAGIIALIWSIHRFGRLGPDAPIVFEKPEEEAPRKKKKKKKRAALGPKPDEPDIS